MYFNPRSREGSDRRAGRRSACPSYFNPRSREGSDDPARRQTHRVGDFNPRSREGSDLAAQGVDFQLIKISIHAPVKGATNGVLFNSWTE